MTRRIAVWLTHKSIPCWHLTTEQAARLERALPDAELVHCPDEDAFLTALPTATVAVVWHFKPEWLPLAPKLRWIATPAAGRDYFSIPNHKGLLVTYGAFHGELMAETVVGMMLASTRGILDSQRLQLAGELWPRPQVGEGMRPLRGSHVVILGFGSIGQWVGRLLKPFGVRVTGVRRNAAVGSRSTRHACDRVVSLRQLNALLPETDHLVLSLPGTRETDRLLDAQRLRRLPPHARLYNVGRGNAIDEPALAAALRQGRLAGACLDVFSKEPLPSDSPLRGAPNLLLMPHASAISPNYLDLFLDEFRKLYRARFPDSTV